MKLLKRIFVYFGNILPPNLNKIFYNLCGVKIGSDVWIGNNCNFDTLYPENIKIQNNVCISFGVTLITHFDPTEGINDFPIKKYKKNILIKKGTFIGPKTIIMPGVTIEENCFIKAGSVIKKSIPKNSIVEGNPGCIVGILNDKSANIINKLNHKNHF